MSTPLRPVPTLVSRNSFHVLTVEEIEDIPHSETKLVLPSERIIKPVSPAEKRTKKESRQSSSHIGRMENEDSRDKLEINIMLRTVNTRTAVSVKALLDSGATGLFLEDSFVKEMGWDADADCSPVRPPVCRRTNCARPSSSARYPVHSGHHHRRQQCRRLHLSTPQARWRSVYA